MSKEAPQVAEDTGQGEAGARGVSVAAPASVEKKPEEQPQEPVVARKTRGKKDEPEEDDGEMVSVPKKTLDTILKRLDSVEDQNKVLTQVADKGRMARVEALRAQGKLVKSVRITKLDGKYVLGWKLLEDDVHFEGDKLIEKQTIEVFFQDKSKRELPLRNWANTAEHVEGEVISEAKDRDGNINLVVQMADGEEITIGQNFVN